MSEDNGNDAGRLRKLVLPAAVSLAGAGMGLVLSSRSKLKESVPDMKDGVGDLTTDLRNKLDSVLGKDDSSQKSTQSKGARSTYSRSQLAARRRERQERRERRRTTS